MTHTYNLIEAIVSMDMRKQSKENRERIRSSVLVFLVAYLTIGSWLAFTHRVMSALGSLLSNREAIKSRTWRYS